jgi:hypothetical protein
MIKKVWIKSSVVMIDIETNVFMIQTESFETVLKTCSFDSLAGFQKAFLASETRTFGSLLSMSFGL